MKAFNIEATSHSPKVSFDPEKQLFEISGESRPENASVFYEPILNWIKDFEATFDGNSEAFNDPFTFDFKLDYFNSTSAKFILDFCKKIGQLQVKGLQLNVRWLYEEDDDDMLEVGKEMARMAKIPFEYVEIEIDAN
ncbi:MAG: DUF1987 domain-containing protein [Anaerolineales bacterium]|jgi:hypothetical protein